MSGEAARRMGGGGGGGGESRFSFCRSRAFSQLFFGPRQPATQARFMV